MHPRLLRKPPPTLIERIVGRRRARTLRRRCGLAALGIGAALLRPKPRYRLTSPLVISVAALTCVVIATAALPLR